MGCLEYICLMPELKSDGAYQVIESCDGINPCKKQTFFKDKCEMDSNESNNESNVDDYNLRDYSEQGIQQMIVCQTNFLQNPSSLSCTAERIPVLQRWYDDSNKNEEESYEIHSPENLRLIKRLLKSFDYEPPEIGRENGRRIIIWVYLKFRPWYCNTGFSLYDINNGDNCNFSIS